MKISNATVTNKQNFIEKYCLMKNLYNQNCLWKNEGSINRVSQRYLKYIVYTAFSYCNQLDLSPLNKTFRQYLKFYIIQPISVTYVSIWFKNCTIKGSVSTMYAYNESLPLLIFQHWLISGFSLFSVLILIVPSESISWVDFLGT